MDQIIQWSNFGMYEMECINFYIFNSCLKASFSTRPFNTHIPDILLSTVVEPEGGEGGHLPPPDST